MITQVNASFQQVSSQNVPPRSWIKPTQFLEDYLEPEDDVAEQHRPDGSISDQGFGNILPSHTGDLHRSVSPISSSILTLTAASPQKEDTEKVRSSDTQIEVHYHFIVNPNCV